jgi:hypothetical protein
MRVMSVAAVSNLRNSVKPAMNSFINERLRDFFLGDDAAWDDIIFEFYDRMLSRLERKFYNLPFAELQDVVSDWVTAVFEKVGEERARAEAEGKIKNLSAREIADLKIEYCAARIGFDAAKGTFENWMWAVLYRIERRGEVVGGGGDGESGGEFPEPPPEDAARFRGTPENPWAHLISEAEIVGLMKKLKMFLNSVLEENELLYFHIWLKYGDDPSGKIVKEIFKSSLGKDIGDATVTAIKKRFIRVSYLNLLEFVNDANALKNLFRRLIDANDDENDFFADMTKLIWRAFYNDEDACEESRRKISPDLWRRWETLVQRSNVQNQILSAAYRHFQNRHPRPAFCRTVEIYANNRFGGKVRELFFQGDGGNSQRK